MHYLIMFLMLPVFIATGAVHHATLALSVLTTTVHHAALSFAVLTAAVHHAPAGSQLWCS